MLRFAYIARRWFWQRRLVVGLSAILICFIVVIIPIQDPGGVSGSLSSAPAYPDNQNYASVSLAFKIGENLSASKRSEGNPRKREVSPGGVPVSASAYHPTGNVKTIFTVLGTTGTSFRKGLRQQVCQVLDIPPPSVPLPYPE